MDTSISSYGYKIKKKDLNLKQIEKIRKDLMITPFIYDPVNNKQNTDKKFNILLESPKALYVPRFYGISNYGLPKSNKLPDGDNADLNFKGSLREEQKPIVESYLKASEEKGAGMISLRCGGGKTVLALHIASILKKKTIVIVHKTFLMDQWAERIREFLPGARIGYIQASTIDIDNKDIVIAMLQSLSMKEYPDNLFESFGFSVWDEAHHLSAEVFSKAMRKISPKYLLGLSATIKRNDNTHHVFHYYLGDVVYKQADEINKNKVECRLIQYESDDAKYSKIETIFNGNICRPRMVNNITEYKPRTDVILKYLYK
jgi:superfamily II DNA or RNA helicase